MTMESRLNRTTLRVALSLCELAATATDVHIRQDLLDEALAVLECVADGDRRVRRSNIVAWCDLIGPVLERLGGGVPVADIAYARAKVLRVRSVAGATDDVPAQREEPRPTEVVSERDLRPASQKVLALIRSQDDIRSNQIITMIGSDFSPRTIKRALRELTDAGLVERSTQGTAVTYRSPHTPGTA